MIKNNIELMNTARESLRGKWSVSVGATAIYFLLSMIFTSATHFFGIIADAIITGPLTLGYAFFILSILRNQEHKVSQIFSGFTYFITAFLSHLLITIFTLLWTLLLIIPGIIAAISYSLTYYIIADNPSITASAAIKKSKDMMYGHKQQAFYLWCRFIGWFLLSIITGGIGFLWSIPYFAISYAKFYEEIKNNFTDVKVEVEE